MKKKSSLEKEQKNPSGAGGPLSAEALRIEGAEDDLLYVIVGVLLPEDKVAEAETLAKNQWTRSRATITRHKDRADEWAASVKKWRSQNRQGPKEGPQAPGSATLVDELQYGPGGRAPSDLLSDQNEIPGFPVSKEKSPAREICQAKGLTDAAPKDAAWVDQIKNLLNPSAPELSALRLVMKGNEGVDMGIAKYAVEEFKVAFPIPDGNEDRNSKMSPEDLVQIARGIQLMQQQEEGYEVG